MKINAIHLQPQINNKYTNLTNNSQINEYPQQHEQLQSVSAAQVMSYHPNFEGGYSINLGETITNLDKLAQKYPDIYPKHIREWAEMLLEEGNKGNDTLITVHKSIYGKIKDCFSLEGLRKEFPEMFDDVLPASSLEAREGTLLDDLNKGKLEYFNTEEDLSLQIIKLYWGEGFSLNDLKAYTGGRDINAIMNKLRIPKVNRHYGHILKFSDPEYNERLTKQMVQKRQEALDIKAQKQDNEPVYIKRGPLSAEHKQHISEGLLRYYEEHPERIFVMSERQKQYYIDNPDQAKILHRVMVKAWNVFGADHIKKALSKFLQQNKAKNFDPKSLERPYNLSREQSQLMKKFWATNEWAKKSFSKNVSYAWKKVKEEQDMFYIFDITPNLFKQRFFKWCEREGIDTTDLTFDGFKYYPHKPELNELDSSKINKYTPKFIDSCPGDESQKIANSYQLTLIKFGQILKALEKSNATQDTKDLALVLRRYIHNAIFDSQNIVFGSPTAKSLNAHEVQRVYVYVAECLMDQHENRLIKQLTETLNNSYNYLDKNWVAGKPMILNPNDSKF